MVNNGLSQLMYLLDVFVLGIVACTIQANNPALLLISPTETFVTIMTFFFIENPDVKLIPINMNKDVEWMYMHVIHNNS